jgi:hypothetical protein
MPSSVSSTIRRTADTVFPYRNGYRALTSFHQFTALPEEIQLMIWKLACYSDPKTLSMTLTRDEFKFDTDKLPLRPAVLQACSLSRMMALETYTFINATYIANRLGLPPVPLPVGHRVPVVEEEKSKPRSFLSNLDCDSFYLQFGGDDLHYCFPNIRPVNKLSPEDMQMVLRNCPCPFVAIYQTPNFATQGVVPHFFLAVRHLALNIKLPKTDLISGQDGYRQWYDQALEGFLAGLVKKTTAHFPRLESLDLVVRPQIGNGAWWEHVSRDDMEMKPWDEVDVLPATEGEHQFGKAQLGCFDRDIRLWYLGQQIENWEMKVPNVRVVVSVPKDFPEHKGEKAVCGCPLQVESVVDVGDEMEERR